MKKINLLFPLICILSCFAFTEKKTASWENVPKEEVLQSYQNAISWFLTTQNFRVDIDYASYADHTGIKPVDKSPGFYKRNKNNLVSSAMGITTIQNDRICLMIDSVSQLIILKRKTDLTEKLFDSKSLSALLDNVSALKKRKDAEGGTTYRLEFKPNDLYEAFEFKLNEKGLFTKIISYYSRELQADEEDANSMRGKPRMEVTLKGYQANVKFNNEKEFSEALYIKEEKGKISLKENYKNYELKDYRFDAAK